MSGHGGPDERTSGQDGRACLPVHRTTLVLETLEGLVRGDLSVASVSESIVMVFEFVGCLRLEGDVGVVELAGVHRWFGLASIFESLAHL